MELLQRLLRNPLVGVFDARIARTISGWARNTRRPPVTVDFTVDGRRAGSTVSSRPRRSGFRIAAARCAFVVHDSGGAFRRNPADRRVRARGGANPLTNGFFAVRVLVAPYRTDAEILRHGLWAMAGGRENTVLHIGGWTISPPGSEGRITVNGEPVALDVRAGAGDWKSPLPLEFQSFAFEYDIPIDPRLVDMRFSFGADSLPSAARLSLPLSRSRCEPRAVA